MRLTPSPSSLETEYLHSMLRRDRKLPKWKSVQVENFFSRKVKKNRAESLEFRMYLIASGS